MGQAQRNRLENHNTEVKRMGPTTISYITCSTNGHAWQEEIPTDACQFYYECKNCQAVLRLLDGDCCVFCSYADTLCPPKQMEAMSSAEIPAD
jgi:hypothetical protein